VALGQRQTHKSKLPLITMILLDFFQKQKNEFLQFVLRYTQLVALCERFKNKQASLKLLSENLCGPMATRLGQLELDRFIKALSLWLAVRRSCPMAMIGLMEGLCLTRASTEWSKKYFSFGKRARVRGPSPIF
jgi:hypothetical protein